MDSKVDAGKLGLNGDLGYGGLKIRIDGIQRQHSIGTHATGAGQNVWVTFQLTSGWRRLKGHAALDDSLNNIVLEKRDVTFSIIALVDGKEKRLWGPSPPIRKSGDLLGFDVALPRARELKIRLQVNCKGTNAYARAVWVDPVVEK